MLLLIEVMVQWSVAAVNAKRLQWINVVMSVLYCWQLMIISLNLGMSPHLALANFALVGIKAEKPKKIRA